MSDANHVSSGAGVRGGKYLTFFLAGEEYGIEILKVHEIIGMMPITRVPRTPQVVRGVINLRGKVIPIMDLRRTFGMEPASAAEETSIIVVQVHGTQTGVVVDSVSEVADIRGDDVEDAPQLGSNSAMELLLGIAKTSGHVKLLLDIERVLTRDDATALSEAAQAA
jgi:purine-binding chemotaxis protein CheW